LVGNFTKDGDQDGGVEPVIVVRQSLGIAAGWADVAQPTHPCSPHHVIQELLPEVEDLDRPGVHPLSEAQRVVARSRADLEHVIIRLGFENLSKPGSRDQRVR
jgi:hypothetical protein